VKRIITGLLTLIARLGMSADPLRRAWAHAKLRARIEGSVDPSVVVLGCPEVHGTRRIKLGRNLYLYRELYFETQQSGTVSIGDNVVISRGTHIVAFARVDIGANTMIGEYVSVRDANHKYGDGSPLRNSGYAASPIEIGKNVWLGRGVTVLGGVRIGDNAVVGANAVVTRDVAEGAIVAGVPARPLQARPVAMGVAG
jgi:acetyltransferase-like isoleucine patch superfamily enzyme